MGDPGSASSAPERAIWVINSACPSRCVYCDIASQRETRELDRRLAVATAEQLVSLRFRQVIFVGGEPLLFKHLGPVLEVLKRGGVDSAVFTGGIPGDHARYVEALQHGATRVVYSIDSGRGNVNDRVRGRLGTTLDLVRFAESVKLALPEVEASVSTVVSRQTVETVGTVWDRMKQFRLTAWVAVLAGDNFTGSPAEHFLPPSQVRNFYLEAAPAAARQVREESPDTDFLVFPVPLPLLSRRVPIERWSAEEVDETLLAEFEAYSRGAYNERFVSRFGCPLVGSDLTIGVGGQIYPCSQAPIIKDEYSLGSVHDVKLSDVLAGGAIKRFREAIPHAPCSRCWAPSNVPRATLDALFARSGLT
ncbi:MAG: radical SAM protein [Polyangiaceae bacterium]|nr:radical SAM protein [Myxococcales bacterium]MCB9589041.1 radical SAM protein [Polyangiaceae bacterium]